MGIDGEFLKKKSLQMEFARTGKVGRQTLLCNCVISYEADKSSLYVT